MGKKYDVFFFNLRFIYRPLKTNYFYNLESQVDANEISDSIADETFSLLCTSNMSSTALALLSILDKALLEVSAYIHILYITI